MRYPIDFAKFNALIEAVFQTAYCLSWYVQHTPEQVTACCLLFLAGTRLVSWLRKR